MLQGRERTGADFRAWLIDIAPSEDMDDAGLGEAIRRAALLLGVSGSGIDHDLRREMFQRFLSVRTEHHGGEGGLLRRGALVVWQGSGICTWMTSAPQSASCLQAVGPARTCVRSMTRNRARAGEAGVWGMDS